MILKKKVGIPLRKLVTIQRILSVSPIPGADAIEVAKVLGWNVVIKKDEFRVGELAVYAEIDSVFPDEPDFEFLRPRNFRIRTIRLRGQVSQGICFPLSILPKGHYEEGQEVTELIGVVKYEPPISKEMEGITKGAFPSFIPKTDEERVQTMPDKLMEYKGTLCINTEKLDGTSTTFYHNDGEFGVCSKNIELFESERSPYWIVAKYHNVEEKLRALNWNLALQGETVGGGINGNKYQLAEKEYRFYLFNAFDIDQYRYLEYNELQALAKALTLTMVPILDENFELLEDVEELVAKSRGKSLINPNVHREGIVIKAHSNRPNGEKFSLKVINPDFLLKFNDD
jgi:RNA ligase (TIGR02306 family)